MKKFTVFTIVLGALVVASMVSCTKDGVYTPSKKIQRVYVSSTYTDKYLQQSWDWDGKLLNAINYYSSSGGLNWTADYSYDGKRIIRIDDYLNSKYTTYEYDGKNLKSVSFYYKNSLEATSIISFSNNKLDKIVTTYYDSKSAPRNLMKSSYLPLPADICNIIDNYTAKAFANSESKGVDVITWKLTWDGNNISKIEGMGDGDRISVILQYDDKNNPTKGFFDLYSFVDDDLELDGGMMSYSKNNVTKVIVNYSDGDNEVVTFTYQYDKDNYPIMRIEQYSDEDDYKYITYFEY